MDIVHNNYIRIILSSVAVYFFIILTIQHLPQAFRLIKTLP